MSTPDQGLRRALEVAGVPLAILDGEGVIDSVNAQFAALFNATSDALVGHHLVGLCDPTMKAIITSALVRIITGTSSVEMVTIDPDRRRTDRPITLTLTPSHDDDGVERTIFCVANPSTGRLAESEHGHAPEMAASNDAATTDEKVAEHLAAAIERSRDHGSPFALLIAAIDFDDGPEPEGGIGHIVIARIVQRLRASDSVIHHGADGVLFLAEHLGTEQDAVGVAYRMLSTTVDPIRTGTTEHDILMTIGIAVGDSESTPAELIQAGRLALSEALTEDPGGFRTIDVRNGTDGGTLTT